MGSGRFAVGPAFSLPEVLPEDAQEADRAGIARLNPPERGYDWYPDSLLPSFGLRVYPTGSRVFGITRRWHGAKHPTFHPHGKWPELSLAAARKKAREILSDPDAARASRQRGTVAATAAEWLKRDQAGNRSVDEVARIFGKDVLPVLGDRPIAEVRKRDIIDLIDAIADRGSPIMANRTLASVKRLFRWAAPPGISSRATRRPMSRRCSKRRRAIAS
jgi:hypothetical protein